MRKIKFRGKRVDNGEWAYGYLYIHEPPLQCFKSDTPENVTAYILKTGFADWNMSRPIDFVEVDIETLGQFTGKLDDAGVEIYEDDIIRVSDATYMDSTPCYTLFTVVYAKELCIPFYKPWDSVCVIGNKHDNPDMLK